jgi:nucleotidyltransferase/DNA polymerase involved in DNA repair
MFWIGRSTAQLLRKNGITTIGDLAKKENKSLLQKLLDKN